MDFILRKQNPHDRQRALAHISGLSYEREHRLSVVLNRRSSDANRYYWSRIREIADHLHLLSEEVHDVARHVCLGYVEIIVGDEPIRILKHTRSLDREQFADYVTAVEAWAATELGVMFREYREYDQGC